MISVPITLEKTGEGRSIRLSALLRYDEADPYAVHLDITMPVCDIYPDGHTVWTFARDLLAEGLLRRAGEGDVLIWPDEDIIAITLADEDEEAVLLTDAQRAAAFLTLTYAAVPRGTETDHIDVGAELARMFGEAA